MMEDIVEELKEKIISIEAELEQLKIKIENIKHEINERQRLLNEFRMQLTQNEIRTITSEINRRKKLLEETEKEYHKRVNLQARIIFDEAFKKLLEGFIKEKGDVE
jgi:chromosome segregation ATPase